MKIYHGTCLSKLDAILKQGLKPRGRIKGNWDKYPSRPDMVYMTVAYPFYFASCTGEEGDKCLVLEIDTDELKEDKLFPDEDFIAQAKQQHDDIPLEMIHHVVRKNLEQYQHVWKESLEYLGNCCYKGKIPPKAITRYCVFDSPQRPYLSMSFLDPTISILNFRIIGRKYVDMVKWMFGDIPLLPMATPEGIFNAQVQIPDDMVAPMRESLNFWEKESADRTGIEVVRLK